VAVEARFPAVVLDIAEFLGTGNTFVQMMQQWYVFAPFSNVKWNFASDPHRGQRPSVVSLASVVAGRSMMIYTTHA